MTDTRDTNRRVDFSEAGEGVVILLRNSGVRELYNKFGKDYFSTLERGLLNLDLEVMDALLKVSAHRGDERIEITFEDLDNITVEVLRDKLLDAMTLSINGRTYKEQVDNFRKQLQDLSEDPSLKSLAGTLEDSKDEPTGPDSDQQNSTD